MLNIAQVAFNRAKAAAAAFALAKTRSSIREYGAKGGSFNDIIVLQGAIDDKFKKGGGEIVFPDDQRFSIGGNLIIKDNVTISGGKIKMLGLYQVILQGVNPAIRNMEIDARGFGTGNLGIVELVETKGARIEHVKILGNHLNKGIMCKTQASDTVIDDVEVNGIGWGILFNDGSSEQDKTDADGNITRYRTWAERSYHDLPLGNGLTINRFVFNPGLDRTGDGIEINCPDFGFTGISVTNCRINGTYATSSNGIGIGFANCYHVTVSDCFVQNAAFDAYHFEKGAHHHVHHCQALNSGRGLVMTHVQHSKADNNIFINCAAWGTCYNHVSKNGVPFQMMYDVIIQNNTWWGHKDDGSPKLGLLIGWGQNIRVENNTFREYAGATNSAIIQFYNFGNGNVTNSKIRWNYIDKGNSTVIPTSVISVVGADAYNNEVVDNEILGYPSTSISVDVKQNRLKYKVRRNVNGTSLYNVGGTIEMAGDPKGYANARVGIKCINTLTGKEWIGTGTTNQDWAEYLPQQTPTA